MIVKICGITDVEETEYLNENNGHFSLKGENIHPKNKVQMKQT